MTSIKKDSIFVFSFLLFPSIRFGSTTFTAFFDVSSPVIAQWRSEQEGTEETYDGIVGTSIARLTRRYDDFPAMRYLLCWSGNALSRRFPGRSKTMLCRSLPGFPIAEAAGRCGTGRVLSPSEGFDVPKRNREFIECFREVSPKAVIEWAIILSNQLELLRCIMGLFLKKRVEMPDKMILGNTEFVFDRKLGFHVGEWIVWDRKTKSSP